MHTNRAFFISALGNFLWQTCQATPTQRDVPSYCEPGTYDDAGCSILSTSPCSGSAYPVTYQTIRSTTTCMVTSTVYATKSSVTSFSSTIPSEWSLATQSSITSLTTTPSSTTSTALCASNPASAPPGTPSTTANPPEYSSPSESTSPPNIVTTCLTTILIPDISQPVSSSQNWTQSTLLLITDSSTSLAITTTGTSPGTPSGSGPMYSGGTMTTSKSVATADATTANASTNTFTGSAPRATAHANLVVLAVYGVLAFL